MSKDRAGGPGGGDSGAIKLAKNEKGGILISEDELKVAWDFFDTKGNGKVGANDIKKGLSAFYKNVSVKEIRYLLNNQQELSFEELRDLLNENTLKGFDPVKDAFRVYDPNEHGCVDMSVVQDFFQSLGFGEVSEEDSKLIQEMADADGDGKIGLDDFRLMVPLGKGVSTSPKK